MPVCPALSGAPNASQQLQNELQELQPGIVLAGKSDRELRGMRKNLRGASSADDDEERYSDEEEQEEEPAPKSRKRKKKGELRSSIPDDAPPPALSPEDQMMTIWKNTELGLQAIIQTKGLVIRSEFVPVATIRKFMETAVHWQHCLPQVGAGAPRLTSPLTEGIIARFYESRGLHIDEEFVVQILGIHHEWTEPFSHLATQRTNPNPRRVRRVVMTISDGDHTMHAVLPTQLHNLATPPAANHAAVLRDYAIITVSRHFVLFNRNDAGGASCRLRIDDVNVHSYQAAVLRGTLLIKLLSFFYYCIR